MSSDVLELGEAAELLVDGVDDHKRHQAQHCKQHASEEVEDVVEKYQVVDNCAVAEMTKPPDDKYCHSDKIGGKAGLILVTESIEKEA